MALLTYDQRFYSPKWFVWIIPQRLKVEDRGTIFASYPAGSLAANPKGIILKSPACSTVSS